MVRLLMVRHGESEQNAYMEKVMYQVLSGQIPRSEFNATMRRGPPGADGGVDSDLTEKGASQAEKLGKVWGPLLLGAASKGRLVAYVSPYLRCCKTADPFMNYIRQHGVPDFQGIVLPSIMEEGGLATSKDLESLDNVGDLIKQGKRKEGIRMLKQIKWTPMGLTGRGLRERFPWSRQPNANDKTLLTKNVSGFCLPIKEGHQWYNKGWEGSKAENIRMTNLFNWIKTLQYNGSGETGDDVTIVWFTHGGTIANVSNRLTGAAVERGLSGEKKNSLAVDMIFNTSVTSFFLPSPAYSYRSDRPSSSGAHKEPWTTRLEFFNDTAHLEQERLIKFAKLNFGNAKL